MSALNPSDIAEVAVYPPIGIARVGNAPGADDYMLASEVIGGLPDTRGGFRDTEGRIKRQAVRFRIYATLHSGAVVELDASNGAAIEWRVHVANLKAGWYEFLQAMDLPDGLSKLAPRRNAAESNRQVLDIRPRPRTISGKSLAGPEYAFGDGKFFDTSVYLGELRTDEQGRLIFLGGLGASAPKIAGTQPKTFANNDLWHDDVADGTVRATVVVGGTSFEAEPGYVTVAPPNFAPGLFGVVTMDDVVTDMLIDRGLLAVPQTTSFTRDIWPFFDRMTGLGWVNHGTFIAHGPGSPLHARDGAVIARLADASAAAAAWRREVFELVMTPGRSGPADHKRLPQVFGDAYGEDPKGFRWKLERLGITPTQYAHLERWRDGSFVSDWPGDPPRPPVFTALSPEEQIGHLQRAALHECLGGPFHPGIELTWIMRQPSMWKAPYRLNLIAENARTRQDFGAELTPEACLGPDGPLASVGPGALTRWLGIPWQTDEASCNSEAEYSPSLYLSMPTFWGARVPDQVLSREAWGRVAAADASDLQRLKHFCFREDWLRDIRGRGYFDRIANMVVKWWQLGLVMPQDTALAGQALGLPPEAHVESQRPAAVVGTNEKVKLIEAIEALADLDAAAAGPRPLREQEPSVPVPPRESFRRGEV